MGGIFQILSLNQAIPILSFLEPHITS
jgi:hypothetical protein